MIRFTSKTLSIALLLSAGAVAPAAAQSTSASAQCDQVMMVGPQHFAPAVVAACTPYFTALADGAVATGTFATIRPGTTVTLSTSGNGG